MLSISSVSLFSKAFCGIIDGVLSSCKASNFMISWRLLISSTCINPVPLLTVELFLLLLLAASSYSSTKEETELWLELELKVLTLLLPSLVSLYLFYPASFVGSDFWIEPPTSPSPNSLFSMDVQTGTD